MTTPNHSTTPTLPETAKGIAVRAGILSAAALIVGAWIVSLAAKAAGGLVQIVAGLLLLTIGGGFAAWEVRKAKHRLSGRDSQPALS